MLSWIALGVSIASLVFNIWCIRQTRRSAARIRAAAARSNTIRETYLHRRVK